MKEGRHIGNFASLELVAAQSATGRSTLPRGSAAGKGQSLAAARRCVRIKSAGRAASEEWYSSRPFANPATIDTSASVRHRSLMSRGVFVSTQPLRCWLVTNREERIQVPTQWPTLPRRLSATSEGGVSRNNRRPPLGSGTYPSSFLAMTTRWIWLVPS